MKAQSAIEYLTTYGWMFVTLAIASGAIYSFVGGQCVESASGFTGSNIQIQDFGIQTDSSNLSLLVESRSDNQIILQEINIVDTEGTRNIDPDEGLAPRAQKQLGVRGFEQSDSCNTMDVEIVYEVGTLEDQYMTGEITSNIQVTDEAFPEAFDSVDASMN